MSVDGRRRPGAAARVTVPAAMMLGLMLWWLGSATSGRAQGTAVGTAQNAVGTLLVVRADGIEDRLQGQGLLPLYEGDELRTGGGSQGLAEFRQGIQVALNEATQFRVLSRWEKARGVTRILRVSRGEIWVKTAEGPPTQLEVETPVATAVVEGTEFNLKVQEDGQSVLTVIRGIVQFGTPFGTCPIRAGTMSYGARGKRCTKPAETNAQQAIDWTRALVK